MAPLLGLTAEQLSRGKMTYDLRRLRLHGLIERIPRSHRYRVTDRGFRAAVFLSSAYARLLRPGLAMAHGSGAAPTPIRTALDKLDRAVDRAWEARNVAA